MQFNVFTRTHGHMMYIGSIAHKCDEAREPSKSLSGSFRALGSCKMIWHKYFDKMMPVLTCRDMLWDLWVLQGLGRWTCCDKQIEGCDIGCSAGALLGNQKSRFHTLPMEIRKTHERPVPVAVILTITFKATLDPLKVERTKLTATIRWSVIWRDTAGSALVEFISGRRKENALD